MACVTGEEEETHILLVAFAAQGHLNPMLRFGKRLATKGIHVTIATTEVAREKLLNSSKIFSTSPTGNALIATHSDTQIRMEFFSDGLSLESDRTKDLDYYMDCLCQYGPRNLSTLVTNFTLGGRRKIACIINNPFVAWVADVALQHNIPCAMLWIQPSSLFALYYRFYNKLDSFPMSDRETLSLPGLPVLKHEDLPTFILPSSVSGSFSKMLSEVFTGIKKLKWVLGNSFYELEPAAVESLAEICPIRPVGPLVPSVLLGDDEGSDIGVDMWKPDETCIKWLDTKPDSSVIYVALGSLIVLSAKQMEELALGLRDSNRPFLWVVKPPDFPGADRSGELPQGFLDDTREQGLVVKWCAQTQVLMHPAVGCFITHCGWSSTLETVAAGVPAIGFPQWTDQPTNAKLISDVFRTGVRLRGDGDGVIRKEEVLRCIGEVMDGPRAGEFRKRGLELKEAAAKAVEDGGSSDRYIQLFVDELSGPKIGSMSG